jgi:amino acid permease
VSFLGCYFGYKFYHKTSLVKLSEIDLQASQRFYASQAEPMDVVEAPAVGFKAKALRLFNKMIS